MSATISKRTTKKIAALVATSNAAHAITMTSQADAPAVYDYDATLHDLAVAGAYGAQAEGMVAKAARKLLSHYPTKQWPSEQEYKEARAHLCGGYMAISLEYVTDPATITDTEVGRGMAVIDKKGKSSTATNRRTEKEEGAWTNARGFWSRALKLAGLPVLDKRGGGSDEAKVKAAAKKKATEEAKAIVAAVKAAEGASNPYEAAKYVRGQVTSLMMYLKKRSTMGALAPYQAIINHAVTELSKLPLDELEGAPNTDATEDDEDDEAGE